MPRAVIRVIFAVPLQPPDEYFSYSGGRSNDRDVIEPRIVCPNLCGRSYKRMEHLKRHISYECGVEPKYKCHVCQRKFVYNFSMKKHMGLVHKEMMTTRP
ncbi:Zinc finger C2H2-type [Cinara cedri]|uniref:Zinc finger C2H2-type n=1 Tax=Cinara cedri TaxID=506608 RepID=A0A5E4MFW7_9HEMI|nr:Zinc finger C2H2-type [Cinara cedri]